MKTSKTLLLAALAASIPAFASGETPDTRQPERLEEPDSGWRIGVGLRAAPSVKTKARIDSAKVIGAVGRVVPFGKSSVSTTTETTAGADTSSDGNGSRSEEEAVAAAAQRPDGSWEFDNGFIRPDSAGVEGETWNWHFDSAEAFSDGVLVGRTEYSAGDGSATITTRTETRTSVSEKVMPDKSISSDDTAHGFEVQLSRTLLGDDTVGVDCSLGWTIYDDVDIFKTGARVYEGRATSRTSTETTVSSSGFVETSFSVGESFDLDYATNPDGSIGGASYDGLPSQPGWNTPLLEYDPASVTTTVSENGAEEDGKTTTHSGGSSKTRTRVIDVRSSGELSLQELRLGLSPFWKATDQLRLRVDAGVLGTYAEIETRSAILVNGAVASSTTHTDDDWKLQGYAGLSVAYMAMESLELSAGAEVRFPRRRVRFDDGCVSGSTELAKWDAFVAISIRF